MQGYICSEIEKQSRNLRTAWKEGRDNAQNAENHQETVRHEDNQDRAGWGAVKSEIATGENLNRFW